MKHIGEYQLPDIEAAPAPPVVARNPGCFEYTIFAGHSSCTTIWDEWHGLNFFSPEANVKFYPGGIKKLETDFKNSWRRSFDGKAAKLFS